MEERELGTLLCSIPRGAGHGTEREDGSRRERKGLPVLPGQSRETLTALYVCFPARSGLGRLGVWYLPQSAKEQTYISAPFWK